MENKSASSRRTHWFCSKYFWLPVIAAALSLVTATAWLFLSPPTFVSTARLWETIRLDLPDSLKVDVEHENSPGSYTELLRSQMLRARALGRMSSIGEQHLDFGREDLSPEVDIRVLSNPKSTVYTVEARSSDPEFISRYLDALLHEFLEFRRNAHLMVSGETLASLSEQVMRMERTLLDDREDLEQYERTNHAALSRLQPSLAVDCMVQLNSQLSSLQLEALSFERPALSVAESNQLHLLQRKIEFIRDSLQQWETRLQSAEEVLAGAELRQRKIQRGKELFDRLVAMLQKLEIERNTGFNPLVILESASPAIRDYANSRQLLLSAGGVGLGIGLGIAFFIGRRQAHRQKQTME